MRPRHEFAMLCALINAQAAEIDAEPFDRIVETPRVRRVRKARGHAAPSAFAKAWDEAAVAETWRGTEA